MKGLIVRVSSERSPEWSTARKSSRLGLEFRPLGKQSSTIKRYAKKKLKIQRSLNKKPTKLKLLQNKEKLHRFFHSEKPRIYDLARLLLIL